MAETPSQIDKAESKKKPMGCFWVLCAIPLVLYGLYWAYFAPYKWRQKITVKVETPSGLVSGSSVYQINVYKDRISIPGTLPGSRMDVVGEAVVVELPNGKHLFALMKTTPDAFNIGIGDILTRMVTVGAGGLRTLRKVRIAASQPVGTSFVVPDTLYPLLVTFDDINDPLTVTQVRPSEFSQAFGDGYKLKQITLSVTDEAVTHSKVERLLPCLLMKNKDCIPTNKALKYGDPMFSVRNEFFKR